MWDTANVACERFISLITLEKKKEKQRAKFPA